jgi:hypothetical protein
MLDKLLAAHAAGKAAPLSNRAKYRGESQKWVKNTGDIPRLIEDSEEFPCISWFGGFR